MPHTFIINSYTTLNRRIITQLDALAAHEPQYDLYYERRGTYPCKCFFAAYHGAELTGFLSLLPSPDSNEAEVTALVHPDYRRMGVFTALLHTAKAACEACGPHLFAAYPNTAVADDAAHNTSSLYSSYSHTEYLMKLEADNPPESASVIMPGFPDDELKACNITFAKKEYDDHVIYSILSDSDSSAGTVIASCCASHSDTDKANTSCIYDVRTLACMRRRGMAYLLMRCIISEASEAKRSLILHCSGRNIAALNLYKKCGFAIKEQIDYYNV